MKFVISDVYLRILYMCYLILYTDGQAACDWPAEIEGTWIDSLKGEVTFFSDGTMTGWDIEADGDFGGSNTFREVWECVNAENFTIDGYVVMRTTDTITHFYFETNVYRCMQLTKITDFSFRYYQREAVQPTIAYDRLSPFALLMGELTATSVLCDHANGASEWEYQVMVASGNEAAAKVQCPYSFVGLYDYTHETHTTLGGITCDNSIDTWDMCSNNTQVTFDYSTCPTQVAYSGADTVWCVDNVPVNEINFAMLYNHLDATTDESSTFRFSCLAVQNAENTAYTMEGSISPQHCKREQTPTGLPINNDGSVSGAKLTFTQTAADCPPCPVLSNPSEGTVEVYTEGAVTLASYTCDPGKSIYGSSIRTCLVSGAWDPPEDPTCTCATPADPANGAAHMQFGVNVTTVNYTCDAGYVVAGNHERTCLADTNSWTGTDPTCEECQTLTTPDFGAMSIVSIGVTSQASFTCIVKYSMDGVSEGYCLNTTLWNSTEPGCTPCQTLTTLFSGSIAYTTNGFVTTASSTCAVDYLLVGSNPLICLSTGAWNDSQPICICYDPAVPDNGTMVVSNANTTATYTCDLYFTMDGGHIRTCLRDGTGWDAVDPICMECSQKTDPSNGTVDVTTNGTLTRASFRCDLNYSMDGESETRCQTTETWLYPDPVCNECGIVYEPIGGSISLSTDGITTSAVFRCEVGRTIDDEPEPYCRSNGTWTDNAATRTCVSCTTLEDLDQGSFAMATNGTHTTVDFICNTGFKLAGAASANCDSSGQWDVLDQQCISEDDSSAFPWLWIVIGLGSLLLLLLIIAGISLCCNYKCYNRVTSKSSKKKKERTDLSLRNIITYPPPMNERLGSMLSKSPTSIYNTSSRVPTSMSVKRQPSRHAGPSRPPTSVSRMVFSRLRQAITPAPTVPNGAVVVQPPAKTPRPPLVTPKPPPVPPTPKPAPVISPTPKPVKVTQPPTPKPVVIAPPPTPRPILVAPPPTPKPIIVAPPPTPRPLMIVPPPTPKSLPVTPTAINLVLQPPPQNENIEVAAPWTRHFISPQYSSSEEEYDSYDSDDSDFQDVTVKKPGKTPWRPAPWDGSNPTTTALRIRLQRAKDKKELRRKQRDKQKLKKRKKKTAVARGKAMLSVQDLEANGSWKRTPGDIAGNKTKSNGVVKFVSPITTYVGRRSNVKKT